MNRDIWVDFNDVAPDGVILTLEKFASHRLEVGERVLAGDDDGNLCEAIVVSRDRRGLVGLVVELGTFQDSTRRHMASA